MKNRAFLMIMVLFFMLTLSSLFSIDIGPFNYGIAAQDGATGRGFILYSEESVHTRFAQHKPLSSNADHFICVKFDGTTWKYDNNTAYFTFTPRTTDILVAEVSFTNDEIISTEGVYDKFEGITYGYASGDLFIEPNIWAGAANNGEFKLRGTHVNLYFTPGDFKKGIAGNRNTIEKGYILYSKENLHTRFPKFLPGTGNSDHFISVKFTNNTWYYFMNAGRSTFTPVDTDILVATVDFDKDYVSSLEGKVSIVHGVVAGYLTGDLQFRSNLFDGKYDKNNFTVSGTYFAPAINVVDNKMGVACQDGAKGTGYIMYSAENVFTRFSAHPPYKDNAYHFIGVKYINNQWHYDNNNAYHPFTPRDTDLMVAYVNFDNDTASNLQGSTAEYYGIRCGFASSDIQVRADQFNGVYNNGEFSVTGSMLAPNLPYESSLLAAPNKRGIKAPKSNSQITLDKNFYLGDVDGDTNTDFIQTAGNRMFMFKTNDTLTGISHAYLDNNIERVFTGDFYGLGYDQIAVIDDKSRMIYLERNYDNFDFIEKGNEFTSIDTGDVIVIGDFDGDRKDEMFRYNPVYATCTMYKFNNLRYKFQYETSFDLSGLQDLLISNLQFRAGDFNGDDRTDLAFITPGGQVRLFHSKKANGKYYFESMFTTGAGTVAADEDISVARIDDNNTDDFAIHQPITGNVDFYEAKYDNGMLKPINTISQAQIPKVQNSKLYWVWNKGDVTGYENGYIRNDALVYDANYKKFKCAHARWSGTAYTYWYWYSKSASNYYAGWPTTYFRPKWLVFKTKMGNLHVPDDQKIDDLVFGSEGSYKFSKDLSYGTYLPEFDVTSKWYDMLISYEEFGALANDRLKLNAIIDTVEYEGFDMDDYFHMVGITNHEKGANNRDGNVLVNRNDISVSYFTHETIHDIPLSDSYSDTDGKYGDQWDIMSARCMLKFNNAESLIAGTDMNVANKMKANWIPADRIYNLNVNSGAKSVDIKIAPNNRPEVRGYMAVLIDSNDYNNQATYVTLEYRQKRGWDRAMERDCVVIHIYYPNNTENKVYLREKYNGPEFLPGETYKNPNFDEGFSVDILSFDAVEGYATVRVNIE